MKSLIVSLFFLAGVSANACVDFTGTYVFDGAAGQENGLEIKQASCAAMEVASIQKGVKSKPGTLATDGKVQKQSLDASTYLLESYTHTATGLRIATVYVEQDIFKEISETVVTKLANGDIQLAGRNTDETGEETMFKVVGTKK